MTNINHLLTKLRDAGDHARFEPHLYHEAADEIEKFRKAMDVQGNAVKILHQAETSELNRLRKTAQEAYAAKMTLDSEREANKILTDEVEKLRSIIKRADEILAEKDDHWSERIEGARNALFEGLEEKR